MKRVFLVLTLFIVSSTLFSQKGALSKPNIIIIYVDDLGYGDLGCYGATGVKTPNIDRLSKRGIKFTDGHCTAATCTPSRFSILTGSYAFRNKAAILPGDAPLLIRPGTATLPGMLQQGGYTTAVIGKWHLGLGNGTINWNGDIKPGPLEIGFNYSFLIPATTDRVPCVFVENHRVFNLDPKDPIEVSYDHKIGNEPTGLERPEFLKMKADTQHSNTIINGISRIGYTKGGKAAWWTDENIADVLVHKATQFVEKNRTKPFFLYLSYTDIHVPRAPHPRFKNKSSMGRRGDVIAQMDWSTGEVLKVLDKYNLTRNTLIIFTSDNGPVLDDGYEDGAEKLVGAHKPSGPFRGGKYSAYEAGTRVPVIVSWPAVIKPGISNALINQVDLFASLAALNHIPLKPAEAPDSYNFLYTWLGKSVKGREVMLEEAFTLALRSGDWKYIAAQSESTPPWLKDKKVETGLSDKPQLYNLKMDLSERNDLAAKYPRKIKELEAIFKKVMESGTRPGYKK